ncbi:UDP-glucose 4-epimerase family protein [Marinobacter sp. LQ44]|uniref:UDP-glucose 4-epimerase family protein n=1 Tax=unclassified Marinobacter TaxID=83889 RepID=UPI000718E2FD|nr:SDR family oxidoreductase [Marinobacter sp. LQ44]AMQ87965.1 hypothetical protein ASQ50_04315 [Marinobacter sp. LQ44]
MNKRLLVTGGSGFVGSALIKRLLSEHREVFAVGRSEVDLPVETVKVSSFSELGALGNKLGSVDVVVHCAARAHIMNDDTQDPLAEYRKVNVDGTLNLARHAAESGVKRFVFVSSIKVNGEQTLPGNPFTEDVAPAPEDPYGISKYEAEQQLQALSAETGMELVIIRPPLVYGPGVKGNFASMIRLMEKGLPLPLGAVGNKRSLVALDNLVDLIVTCVDNPAAANQVFLAGDGQDLSTTELLRGVANAMGKSAWLLPVPAGFLMLGASMLGKRAVAQRLLGSLQVDISKAREILGWQPPVSVEEGLARAVRVD